MKRLIGLLASVVVCLSISACARQSAPGPPVSGTAPASTELAPLPPPPSTSPQPDVLSLESVLIFTPPGNFVVYKELSRTNYVAWTDPQRGWMLTATVTRWPANKRTIAEVAPPTKDPSRSKEISVTGSHETYKGLFTWFADGSGGGASEEWDLTVGGTKGFFRFSCSGGHPDQLETMCHELITSLQITDLGAPVP